VSLRRQALRQAGVHLPENCFPAGPATPDELERRLN
jgi:hypothetical protein